MTDDERATAAECYCGKRGCIETFLSGPGLERDHALRSTARRSSREIVRAAAAGEQDALLSLERYHDRLARGLAAVINVLDPDAIVLGGGMSNLPDLPAAVAAGLPHYVFSDSVTTRVVPNLHGDSSGVRGAAWLWPDG
jgi:fructokinase